MIASIVSDLNPLQKEQIQSMNASFPIDEADFFAIYTFDHTIRSAAAFIEEDAYTYECYAFTDPAYRNRGMFSKLLELAIDELPEDTEFIFYTNGKDNDCMAVLRALEAEPVMEEHMMELDLSTFAAASSASGIDPKTGSEDSCFSLSSGRTDADCDAIATLVRSEILVYGTVTWRYENPYGTVNISVFSSYYYLYGFEIHKALRGQGHGKAFLLQVLSDLTEQGPLPLRLQVSGGNLPALSLYKKTGFQITETLFGYLY